MRGPFEVRQTVFGVSRERLYGVSIHTWIASMLPKASPEQRRLSNWLIIAGLALGVLGMVMAFSLPGFVAILAGQAIIVFGLALGRTLRHAVFAISATAAIWLMPFLFRLISSI